VHEDFGGPLLVAALAPPLLNSPTFSFFFVSTLTTGWLSFTKALASSFR